MNQDPNFNQNPQVFRPDSAANAAPQPNVLISPPTPIAPAGAQPEVSQLPVYSSGGGSGRGKLFAGLAVLLLLVVGGGAYVATQHKSSSSGSVAVNNGAPQAKESLDAIAPTNATVSITSAGLMPTTLDVKAGAEVALVNSDSSGYSVSSSDFATSDLDAGQSVSHTYTQPGTYTYTVGALTGTVNVK